MKNILLAALGLVMISCAGKPGYIKVNDKNPSYFAYSSGETYIPIGPNICWERFEKEESRVLAQYERRFRILAENGGNYTRVWLSAPFFEVEHSTAGVYDEAIAGRIDKLLSLAGKYGIKVKFCLENFRKLTGSPAPFSTSVPFDKPIYSLENGGPLSSIDEFFTSETGKKLYLDRVRFLASRYGENENIFGWELWNEINAVEVDPAVLLKWTEEMLSEVKKLLPNHLVMQSLGSFDNLAAVDTYRSYMTLGGNEVAQVHRYLDPGAAWDICRAPMDTLAFNAAVELSAMVNDKPVVVSEIGAVEANHAGPSLLYDVDTLGVLLHDLLFTPFFCGAAAPGQSWHWQFYIDKNDLWWHFGRFSTAIKGIDPGSEDYRSAFHRENDMRIYILEGKTNTIAWCRDARSNWESELRQGIAAERRSEKLNIKLFTAGPAKSVRIYDPWGDAWSEAEVDSDGMFTVSFVRSFVVKVSTDTR